METRQCGACGGRVDNGECSACGCKYERCNRCDCIKYKDVETLGQCTCFIAAGRCAISVCLLSYCENIRYSVLMDSCVDGEPKDIVRHFDGAIKRFIEIGREKSQTEQAKKEN